MSSPLQNLPGFRDFYPDACAVRNYVFQRWKQIAFRYGFSEYEGPILEPTELFTRKSGDEIVKQLFHFQDGGERAVALRPEVTPTLARMVAKEHRAYKKPLKWFQIGSCFRYETPQLGRGREFYQFNCDILGEAGIGADAELVAMAIDLMLDFGFEAGDFKVRLSDRRVWNLFAEKAGIGEADFASFLQIIDKMEREKPEVTAEKLRGLGTSTEAVQAFMTDSTIGQQGTLGELMENLGARGLAEHVELDLGIVRGLAYYTGVVFEIFDARGKFRAVAGGGRYDNLCKLMGGVDLPAAGFAMGDMVIAAFIESRPQSKSRLMSWLSQANQLEVYVVVADETQRRAALEAVQALRTDGVRVDFALSPTKIGNQFQAAEYRKARLAVIIGSEFPQVKLKDMLNREEQTMDVAELVPAVLESLAKAAIGPLLADQ
jgi:histidyl-tRNA synthetase